MRKRKILLACLVLLYLFREFGPINLSVGSVSTRHSKDYGNITLGSLIEQDYTVNIDWGDEKVIREVKGTNNIIDIEIVEFNRWNLWLFVPFYKSYKPIVSAHVKKRSGEYLGSIILTDKMRLTGFYGRAEILRNVKERYSTQMIEFIDSRSGANSANSGKEMICQDEISLNPFTYSYGDSLLNIPKNSPKASYYCLKPELKKWVDTIFYPNNNFQPISYETAYFDREGDSIIMKRFTQDGTLIVEAKFKSNENSHWGEYFSKGRNEGNLGYSTMNGQLVFIRLNDSNGNEIVSRKYININ